MMIDSPAGVFVPAPPTLPCPKCGEFMVMSRIVLGPPGRDQRTFECLRCEVQETIAVRYE
jgi:hypothetical protein